MEIAPSTAARDEDTRLGESAKVELSGESSNLEHSPEGDKKQSRREELAAAHRAQVARDRPYAEAVRQMMSNLEESRPF